jgi:hypothetical protein
MPQNLLLSLFRIPVRIYPNFSAKRGNYYDNQFINGQLLHRCPRIGFMDAY